MKLYSCDECGAMIPAEHIAGGTTTYKHNRVMKPKGFVHLTFKSGHAREMTTHLCDLCMVDEWLTKQREAREKRG